MTLTEEGGLPIAQLITGDWQFVTVETTNRSQLFVGGETALTLNVWVPPPVTDTVNT